MFNRNNVTWIIYFVNLIFRLFLAPVPSGENGCDIRLFDLAKSVHWIVEGEESAQISSGSVGPLPAKRRKGAGDDSDEEELITPPINDIYRQRQQRRVK